MLGIIKGDNRYEYFSFMIDSIISNELVDFYEIDRLLLPFGGIDEYYNIKGSNINILDILRVNDIKTIYVGLANDKLKDICEYKNIKLYEILKDEDFIIENAHLTAMGIINYLSKGEKIINDYKIVVTGFGYVGFMLCRLLEANKVDFSVYTINPIEQKFLKMLGYKITNFKDFSIIINTKSYNTIKNVGIAIINANQLSYDEVAGINIKTTNVRVAINHTSIVDKSVINKWFVFFNFFGLIISCFSYTKSLIVIPYRFAIFSKVYKSGKLSPLSHFEIALSE